MDAAVATDICVGQRQSKDGSSVSTSVCHGSMQEEEGQQLAEVTKL